MTQPLIERLAVIGVGLIGGSFALALKRAGAVGEVVGIGRSRANLDAALALGIADSVTDDAAAGVKDADLVFLATPVLTMERLPNGLYRRNGAYPFALEGSPCWSACQSVS